MKSYDDDDKMAEEKLLSSAYDEKVWNRVQKELRVKVGRDGKIRSKKTHLNGSHKTEY